MLNKPEPLHEELTIGVLLGAFTLKNQVPFPKLRKLPEYLEDLPIDPDASARETYEHLVAEVVSPKAEPGDYVLIPLIRGDDEVYELSQFERESKLHSLAKFDIEWIGLYKKGEPHDPRWPALAKPPPTEEISSSGVSSQEEED